MELKRYSQLADLWGYDNKTSNHTKFEKRTQEEVWMQYLTDILFRPLAETKQGFAIGTNWKFNNAIAFYFGERESPSKKQKEKARQIIADYFKSLGDSSMGLYKQLMQEPLSSYEKDSLEYLMIHVSRLLYAIGQLKKNEDLRNIFIDKKLEKEHNIIVQYKKDDASTITFDSDSSISSDSDSDDYFSEENRQKRKEEARKRDEEKRKLREDIKKMEEEEEKERRLDDILRSWKRQKTQRLKL